MSKIANCKAEVEYAGPHAAELRAFAAPGSWTNEKSGAFAALVEALNAAGYRPFSSSVNTIGLQRKGQSAIYLVPAGQRGALAANAGIRHKRFWKHSMHRMVLAILSSFQASTSTLTC